MDHRTSAKQSTQAKTHLFTVRLWQVPTGDDQIELRGKVQHILSGEVRYFSDWSTLQAFLVKQSSAGEESLPE